MRAFRILAATLWVAAAHAQSTPPLDEDALRAFVAQQVAANGAQVTRFDVQVGVVQTGGLAPCRRTEPFLAAGARLWGRGSVGVRCTEGATWSVLVPVTVRGWGPALVAAAPLAAGTSPGEADVREQEIELSREHGTVVHELAQVRGRSLSRALAPGQPLRLEQFRATLVVQSGDPVRLRIVGTGFAVSASGQALGQAAEGQPVRVRTELGKVLTGVAREGRTVDVAL